MNREDIISLSKLLNTMKEDTKKLDEAMKEKDMEKFSKVKRELIHLSEEINKII